MRRFIGPTALYANKTGADDVGNSTSSAPASSKFLSRLFPRRLILLFGGVLAVAIGIALRRAGQDLLGDQAGVLANCHLDLRGHVGIGLEQGLRILAALAEPLAVIGEPGAGLLDNAGLDAEIEDFSHLGDALAIHDVELDLFERRCQLVLHHLDAGGVADHLVALLDRADTSAVEA